MRSTESLLLIFMLFMGLGRGSALAQSATLVISGRIIGLPNGNISSVQVALLSDGAPCTVVQSHTLANGSFRFSSVRLGNYRVAVSGLPEGIGLKTMTAGDLDLLFNPLRIVASTRTQVLIQVARIEEIRGDKSSVVHVVNTLWSPCLIHQVQPIYPSQAKAAGVVGIVAMSVGVDKDGYVEDVKVLQGHPLLIQSAIDAVRQRRYVPSVLLGETVPVKTTVVIPFGLIK